MTNKRLSYSSRDIAEFELARVITDQLRLDWGCGFRVSEKILAPEIVSAKFRIAGKNRGSAPTIAHATFQKISEREWAPIGPVDVLSAGVMYSAVCIECDEGTLVLPLIEYGACE